MNKPLKVCFVAPHAYSLFDFSTHFVFGGIEVQGYLTATELARRPGFDVSFVVYNHGQPARKFDNVNVIPYLSPRTWGERLAALLPFGTRQDRIELTPIIPVNQAAASQDNAEAGTADDAAIGAARQPVPVLNGPFPQGRGRIVRLKNHPLTRPLYTAVMAVQRFIDFFRLFLPCVLERLRWAWVLSKADRTERYIYYIQSPDRMRTYDAVDADVYISFGANDLTAELTAFCRLNDRRMILVAASDSDFHDSYFHGSNIRNYYGDVGDRCHFAIMRTHRLVTQNVRQRQLAADMFHRQSTIIANPIDTSIGDNPGRPFEQRKHLLWIGKADNTKQPDIFVEIAKRLPEVAFLMVLNPSHTDIETAVKANAPANLTIVPGVARSEVPLLMEQAFALVNTSRFEGYPNTFLEAYRAGAAVVSLNVDPNDILTQEGCGVLAAGDFESLVEGCRRMATDANAWNRAAAAGRAYVLREHDQAVVVDQLINEIKHSLSIGREAEELQDISLGGRPKAPAYYQN